jgi:lysozyme family protein
MPDDFDRCVDVVIRFEGGDMITTDSGGTTKWGISTKAHPTLDVRNLTREQAKDIYRSEYWVASGAEFLNWPMNLAILDCAVNQGVSIAVDIANDALDVAEVLVMRMIRYAKLAENRKDLRPYLRGWLNRLVKVWDASRE